MMRNVNIECDEQQTGPINVIVLQALVNITNRIQRAWDTNFIQLATIYSCYINKQFERTVFILKFHL